MLTEKKNHNECRKRESQYQELIQKKQNRVSKDRSWFFWGKKSIQAKLIKRYNLKTLVIKKGQNFRQSRGLQRQGTTLQREF